MFLWQDDDKLHHERLQRRMLAGYRFDHRETFV